MARFEGEMLGRAERLASLYPDPRSAIIPLCHLAQEQDGYVTEEAIAHIGELVGATGAEVQGTASFYDMLKFEPVGKYVIGVCTNISCMLRGGYELLDAASNTLGVPPGETTADGIFTLEEVECVAHCDKAPAVQINYRYFGPVDSDAFAELVGQLKSGELDEQVPEHGTLIRVLRDAPPPIPVEEIDAERARQDAEREARAASREV